MSHSPGPVTGAMQCKIDASTACETCQIISDLRSFVEAPSVAAPSGSGGAGRGGGAKEATVQCVILDTATSKDPGSGGRGTHNFFVDIGRLRLHEGVKRGQCVGLGPHYAVPPPDSSEPQAAPRHPAPSCRR